MTNTSIYDIFYTDLFTSKIPSYKKWTRTKYENLLTEYINFIKLAGKQRVIPSKDVDEIWHAHILFTKHYNFFCLHFCKKFIHHDPEETKDVKTFIKTKEKVSVKSESTDFEFQPLVVIISVIVMFLLTFSQIAWSSYIIWFLILVVINFIFFWVDIKNKIKNDNKIGKYNSSSDSWWTFSSSFSSSSDSSSSRFDFGGGDSSGGGSSDSSCSSSCSSGD